jgi:hypothetical protein
MVWLQSCAPPDSWENILKVALKTVSGTVSPPGLLSTPWYDMVRGTERMMFAPSCPSSAPIVDSVNGIKIANNAEIASIVVTLAKYLIFPPLTEV